MQINVNKKCSSFVIVILLLLDVSILIQSLRLNLIDNGYEEVHVAIDFSISEKSPDILINEVKSVLNETSHALFIATNNRTFFRKVNIYVPSNWESVAIDEEATITDYFDIDYLVKSHKYYNGRDTFTIQSGECGDPGDYILVSQDFFTNSKISGKGKVLVKEWAKYRWGVFDEHGYPDDSEFPLFYVDATGEVQPNYCINSQLNGTIVYPDSKGTCIFNPITGLPSDSCRFMIDGESTSPVSSSLMSESNIPSIEKFCDSSTHNAKLKNKHNAKCRGRSVWDVLNEHEDFLFNNNPPIFSAPDPQFRVAKLSNPSYCIVIDDSLNMKKAHRSDRVRKAVANWVTYEVKQGSRIAIVSYSNEAETLHPLTTVFDDVTKVSIVNAISFKSTLEISCLECGLQRAIDILHGTTNSVIVLLSADILAVPKAMEFMNTETSCENKVVSILLIDYEYYADDEFAHELIATAFKDFFIIPDDDIGNMFDDALRNSLVIQDSAPKTVKIISESQRLLPGITNTGTFIIDSTLRNNLRVVIQTNDPEANSEFEIMYGPSEEPIGSLISKVLKVVHFSVSNAEEGVWRWEIHFNTVMKDAMLSVEVFVDSVDPSVSPIRAINWVFTEALENSSDSKVYLYSKVKQGDNPIIEAFVKVKLTSADQSIAIEKALVDDGHREDERRDDGIYSVAIAMTEFPFFNRYMAQFTVESHSDTKIVKRAISKKLKNASTITFKRSEYFAPYLSDSAENERNLMVKRIKRQATNPTTTNTDSTTTNTNTTPTNTDSTTTNTGTATTKQKGEGQPTTTTYTESTTTNTASTFATSTTNTGPTTTNTVPSTTNTESTTTNTASTTSVTPTTTNTASTTTNTASTTTQPSTATSLSSSTSTGSTPSNTASTTTNAASTTTNAALTTTGGTGTTTTGTGSTTTGTVSTVTSTGTGTTLTGSTTTGTGSTVTSTGTGTTLSTGTGSTTTGTVTTVTSTGTGTTLTTGTGSTTTGTGSTVTSTGTGVTLTTGSGSTTTGTGSTVTSTGTGSTVTTTVTGSTTTGTGSTVTSTGTGSTVTSTVTGSTVTSTGTGSTVTSTGTGSTATSTGTGSTATTTGTGTTVTTTGTGTKVTSTGTESTTQSMPSSTSTSAVAQTTTPLTLIGLKTNNDTIPPAAVTNVQATATSANTVQISWTATGDDGKSGKATAYQILLSTNLSDVQCQVPTNCSSSATILNYVNSVSTLGVIPSAGQPMNITYTSSTPLPSNVTYYVSVIPLDDSGNFGALSNIAPFLYVAPTPFNYQQYFVTTVWPILYQILQYFFSALYDICFAVIVGSTAGVFALAGLAIYFGGLREGDLELGLTSGNTFPDELAGLMNYKQSPQYDNSPPYNRDPSKPSDDLSDIQGIRKIRGATPDDILFVWSPIQGFDFDGNILYDESHY